MFRREAYRAVLDVLERMDAALLDGARCWFAGGSRLAMDLGECRESLDLDFLCADPSGYADLRLAVRAGGPGALFCGDAPAFPREPRIDQYGIRFVASVASGALRVEIVREGRVAFGPPARPSWSPVACLSTVDRVTEKLLANSDRGADPDTLGRDAIDLAVLRASAGAIPADAWARAEAAYKTAPRADLERSVAQLLGDEPFRERCFSGLRVEDPDRVTACLRDLARDLA